LGENQTVLTTLIFNSMTFGFFTLLL